MPLNALKWRNADNFYVFRFFLSELSCSGNITIYFFEITLVLLTIFFWLLMTFSKKHFFKKFMNVLANYDWKFWNYDFFLCELIYFGRCGAIEEFCALIYFTGADLPLKGLELLKDTDKRKRQCRTITRSHCDTSPNI